MSVRRTHNHPSQCQRVWACVVEKYENICLGVLKVFPVMFNRDLGRGQVWWVGGGGGGEVLYVP